MMGSFGEDLRMERLARGIALEDIMAVTKISRHHLVALEQERFRLLPGGILSKGIMRGYVSVLGLDENDWMKRFLQASQANSGAPEDESGWETFASNVGRARLQRHDVTESRIRWAGAILFLLLVAICVFFLARYLGYRSGWWSSTLPNRLAKAIHWLQDAYNRLLG